MRCEADVVIAANITRTLELAKGMKVEGVHSCKRDEGMGVA